VSGTLPFDIHFLNIAYAATNVIITTNATNAPAYRDRKSNSNVKMI